MDKSQKGYLILVFLTSPVVGLLQLFKSKSEKFYTFFGTLFFGLVGSLFVYVEGSDGYSHLLKAKNLYLDMSFGEFLKKSFEILTFDSTSGSTDMYLHIISFVSASILQIPSLIHVFAGLILGYFFTKSVLLLLKDQLGVSKSAILIGFVFLFLLIRSISALNSIRMWTGMWVLFYGAYSYVLTKEKKYLFVLLFAVGVHFSYVVILIPVIFSYFFKKRKWILIFIYILSFSAAIGFGSVSSFIPQADLLESKQNTYVIDSDDDLERYEARNIESQKERENQNFYKASGEINYLNYSIVGLTIILLFFYLRKESDLNLEFLTATGIVLYSFSNVVSFSPSLAGRTKTIAAVFILAAAIHLQLSLKNYRLSFKNIRRLKSSLILFLVSSIPMVLFQISYIFQNTSFFLFLFPQVSWFFGDYDFSIRTGIGLLID